MCEAGGGGAALNGIGFGIGTVASPEVSFRA